MCVIADPERAIAWPASWGARTARSPTPTTRVLLESAYFDPATTRRTSRALDLPTVRRYRFGRGADIEAAGTPRPARPSFIAEVAGGVVARG